MGRDQEATERGRPASDPADDVAGDDDSLLRDVLGMRPRAPAPRLVAGQRIDAYDIVEEIGAGGMGRVYLARDTRLARDVAIKLHAVAIAEAVDTANERLAREATALAKLAHPNVVTVYDVGTWRGHPWVAMEYVRGGSVRRWLVTDRRTPRAILATFVAAGDGLAAAHEAGLVHRDFKPDNVLVGDDGRARVADFGLARELVAHDDATTGQPEVVTGLAVGTPAHMAHDATPERSEVVADGLTKTGLTVGTPAYMAPEQWAGGEVGPAADQFAYALSLWEALAGARPFPDPPGVEALRAVRPPPPKRMSRRLEATLRRALAFAPGERWPSMRALVAELRRDPLLASPRRPVRTLAAAGAAVLATAGIAWIAWPTGERASECQDAGGDVDELLAPTLIDEAIRATARGQRANAPEEARHLRAILDEQRGEYRALARAACEARDADDYDAIAAAAGRACLELSMRETRALAQLALPGTSSELLPIVAGHPRLARCANPRVLAAWRSVVDVEARAELDAALVLARHRRLADVRAVLTRRASPRDPTDARRVDLLRAAIGTIAKSPAASELVLTRIYPEADAAGDVEGTLEAARWAIVLADRVRGDRSTTRTWIERGLADVARHREHAPALAYDVSIVAAAALVEVGDPERALDVVAQATPLVPASDPVLLDAYAVRIDALAKLQRWNEVETAMATLVERLGAAYGAAHPRVAAAHAHHAALELAGGREDEVRAPALRARALLRGDDSTIGAYAYLELGSTLAQLADPLARVDLARARDLLAARLGESHPDVAAADIDLALLLLDAGEPAHAIELSRRAIDVVARALGADHELLGTAYFNLATAERKTGELDAAVVSARHAVDVYAKRAPSSADHVRALALTAAVHNQRREYAAAIVAARQALAMPTTPDPQDGAWARLEAARALVELGTERARTRVLLAQARMMFELAGVTARVAEIDALAARLPR